MSKDSKPTVFWETFSQLAIARGLSPAAAARAAGFSNAASTVWHHGAIPNPDSLRKLATFFGVSPQSLLMGLQPTLDAFWPAFKQLAKSRGLSPSAAAKQAGLSRAVVIQWEKGSIPRPSTVVKLAAFFGVTPMSLLTWPAEEGVSETQPTPGVFWAAFKQLAKSRGLSPSVAAEQAGFWRSAITPWRKGIMPRAATVVKLAAFFGVTPISLLTWPKEETIPEPQPTPAPFWETFKQLARRRGLTPSAAAKQAGLSTSATTSWRRGATPYPSSVVKLAALFDVSPQVLLIEPKKEDISETRPAPTAFWLAFKQLAKSRGLSPSAAAEQAGLNRAVAFKWRKGAIPRSSTVAKLAAFFDVSPQHLLKGCKKKKGPKRRPRQASDVFWMTFKQLAKSRGLSPSAAAEQAGLNRTVAFKWRKGATPHKKTLDKLSTFFGVSPQSLLTGGKIKKAATQTKPASGKRRATTVRTRSDFFEDIRDNRISLPEDGAYAFFGQCGSHVDPKRYHNFVSLLSLLAEDSPLNETYNLWFG